MADTTAQTIAQTAGTVAGTVNPLLGLALTVAPSIYQAFLGANQSDQANAISPGTRPKYEIPSAEKAALNLQRMLASSNMPGYARAKEDIQASGANAILQGAKFGNVNVSQGNKNLTNALLDLNTQNGGFRERQLENLRSAYQNYAPYQDKQFEINQMQPYEYAMQQSMALKDASNQNIYGALGGFSQAGLTAMQLLGNNGAKSSAGAKRGANQIAASTDQVNGVPYAENFTTQQQVSPQTYDQLSDMLKQVSATKGGVLPVASDPTMDAKLNMLISNPQMMGELYRIIQNLNITTR